MEIDKKGFPSDTAVEYHRALALNLLQPILKRGRLIVIHAFVTKNIRPLRVQNALYMGELLQRDYGVTYISAQTKDEDIPSLINQIKPQPMDVLKRWTSEGV